MGKWGSMLRLMPLVVVLALVLSACGFTTDTVATVGGERITRGELNAAMSDPSALARLAAEQGRQVKEISPADMLQALIDQRLLEVAARTNNVQITTADLAAEQERFGQLITADQRQQQDQQLASLAAAVVRQIRATVNSYGGAAIPDAVLQVSASEEITHLRSLLQSRGTTIAVGASGIPARVIVDEAIVFRNALAGRGVGIPPQELEPLIGVLIEELNQPFYLGSDADLFQQAVSGVSSAVYQQYVRERVLMEKLRPQWAATPVEILTLQELRTDNRQKATEAIQRGRAGTPFAELLRAYQLPGIPPGPNDNALPNGVILASDPQLQAAFQGVEIKEGAYSDVLATADNSQFIVFRIARVERRAPTSDEGTPIYQQWRDNLRNIYEVKITDPALQPQPVAR